MSLMTNISQMPRCKILGKDSLLDGDPDKVETKMVFGKDLSLLVGTLPPGYKSRPHVQDSERILYVSDGELWVFIEDKAYHLTKESFLRIPNMAVYWAWNRSEEDTSIYAFNALPSVGDKTVRESSVGLLSDQESQMPSDMPYITWLSDRYVKEMEAKPLKNEGRGLMITSAELPDSVHLTSVHTGRLSSKFIYGESSNLMLAKRAGGYHSPPHIHDCDQMNFLISGEVWIFLENEAYYLRPGDFMRVPRMSPHWAWNPGKEDCVLLEGHSPVLAPKNKPYACRLIDDEAPPPARVVDNLWLPEEMAEREAQLMRNGIRT